MEGEEEGEGKEEDENQDTEDVAEEVTETAEEGKGEEENEETNGKNGDEEIADEVMEEERHQEETISKLIGNIDENENEEEIIPKPIDRSLNLAKDRRMILESPPHSPVMESRPCLTPLGILKFVPPGLAGEDIFKDLGLPFSHHSALISIFENINTHEELLAQTNRVCTPLKCSTKQVIKLRTATKDSQADDHVVVTTVTDKHGIEDLKKLKSSLLKHLKRAWEVDLIQNFKFKNRFGEHEILVIFKTRILGFARSSEEVVFSFVSE